MSKEKRRGNRELKKPKKTKPAAATATPPVAATPSRRLPEVGKKSR